MLTLYPGKYTAFLSWKGEASEKKLPNFTIILYIQEHNELQYTWVWVIQGIYFVSQCVLICCLLFTFIPVLISVVSFISRTVHSETSEITGHVITEYDDETQAHEVKFDVTKWASRNVSFQICDLYFEYELFRPGWNTEWKSVLVDINCWKSDLFCILNNNFDSNKIGVKLLLYKISLLHINSFEWLTLIGKIRIIQKAGVWLTYPQSSVPHENTLWDFIIITFL